MKFKLSDIASCGINCATCIAYLRKKNRCNGCHTEEAQKRHYCQVCRINNCEYKPEGGFCYECGKFPCTRLKQLDKRYRLNYKISLIDNLLTIREVGISDYLIKETKKWSCPDCNETLSVHRNSCIQCGYLIMN